MKKILLITLEFPPQIGGIATYVQYFAETLNPSQVVVLAPKNKDAEEFDKNLKFKVIRKNAYYPKFMWPRWFRLFWQVLRIVKKEKIDIIYLHHVLPVGYVGWLIKKILKIPYLIFSHGTDIEMGTRSLWKRKRLFQVASQSEQIIFNSQSLKERLLRILPDLESKSSVLYPCPEKIFYQIPEKESLDALRRQYALAGKKVMLTVARMVDGKGYPHLLRMLPAILKEVPNLVWIIVGDGPKKKWFLEEMQKKTLQSAIRFVGDIPHNELKSYYYMADLFTVLTHPDEGREEGLGLVFLEAGACGLPSVAGKSGGVEEAVLHTQTGLIVDIFKGDKPVINSIVELLKNTDYAGELGKNAQDRIRTNFQWEHQLKVIDKWR